MKNILIRNIPDEVLEKLRKRARKHLRSLQQEILTILTRQAEDTPEELLERIIKRSTRWAKENRQFSDSAELIRKNRDRENR